MKNLTKLVLCLFLVFSVACTNKNNEKDHNKSKQDTAKAPTVNAISKSLDQYVDFELNADLSNLSSKQKSVLKHMVLAAKAMDDVFWRQSYGNPDSLKAKIPNKKAWEYAQINYGPWDRLANNQPFIKGVGSKPEGANFYPKDMTKAEFKEADLADKKSLYTLIRRDSEGNLTTRWYHEAFKSSHKKAAEHMRKAAKITDNKSLAKYLKLRAEALLNGKYKSSTEAWMELEDNLLNLIIGPIETYEDQLFGYKASNEGMVLIKDREWSKRLAKYAQYLPKLQDSLPVPRRFRQEKPGRDAELNAYQIVYYSGSANAGPKTIAKNLPNNEEIQNNKGSRRMQLKNAMRAKFDKILKPISGVLIDKAQRKHITFKAFFGCTMFHEVAHGLGLNNTINDQGTVRKNLKEHASAIEEGKADILGIYMVTKLMEWGHLEGNLKDYYTTFMASIFRSVRFGASSAHGKANMIRFNYFKQNGAFERQKDGTYTIHYGKMEKAINSLTNKILKIQGLGNYKDAKQLVSEKGIINDQLKQDLNKLDEQNIPVDITFKQGLDVLGLKQ